MQPGQPQPQPTQAATAGNAAEARGDTAQADSPGRAAFTAATSGEEQAPARRETGSISAASGGHDAGDTPGTQSFPSSGVTPTAATDEQAGAQDPTRDDAHAESSVANNTNGGKPPPGVDASGSQNSSPSTARSPSAIQVPPPARSAPHDPDVSIDFLDRETRPDAADAAAAAARVVTQIPNGASNTAPMQWPAHERSSAAYVYAKRALLFYLSLLITWVRTNPSSQT